MALWEIIMSERNLDNTDNVSSMFYLQLVKDSKF